MMLSLIKERGLHPFPIRQAAMQVLSRLCQGCPANQQVVGELQARFSFFFVPLCLLALHKNTYTALLVQKYKY
jgi:hypothetical protein